MAGLKYLIFVSFHEEKNREISEEGKLLITFFIFILYIDKKNSLYFFLVIFPHTN